MVAWPGAHVHGAYKTIRIRVDPGIKGSWPWITKTTLGEWRTSAPATIWHNDDNKITGGLVYKAFFGAPCWTRAELQKVKAAFAEVGIQCTGAIPGAKSLAQMGPDYLGIKRARNDDAEEEEEEEEEGARAAKKARKDNV
jgi:hypothetical protein